MPDDEISKLSIGDLVLLVEHLGHRHRKKLESVEKFRMMVGHRAELDEGERPEDPMMLSNEALTSTLRDLVEEMHGLAQQLAAFKWELDERLCWLMDRGGLARANRPNGQHPMGGPATKPPGAESA